MGELGLNPNSLSLLHYWPPGALITPKVLGRKAERLENGFINTGGGAAWLGGNLENPSLRL